MKKILPFLALIGLAIPSQAFAIIGGPFDQNTPSGLYGGTFEAIYKMKNGNGIVRFSQSANGQLNAYSFSLIFYKGIIYQGNAAGSVNPKEGYATGMSSSVTTGVEGEDGLATSFVSGAARNIGICNVNWFGKVNENGYNVRFSGKGVAHFFGQLDQEFDAQLIEDANVTTVNDARGRGIEDTTTEELIDTRNGEVLISEDPETVTISTPIGPFTFSTGLRIGQDGSVTAEGETVTTQVLTIDGVPQIVENRNPWSASGAFLQRGEETTLSGGITDNNTTTTTDNNTTARANDLQEASQDGKISAGGERKDFSNIGHRVRIKVYGSKVAYAIPGALGETYQTLNPLSISENAPIDITGMELSTEIEKPSRPEVVVFEAEE